SQCIDFFAGDGVRVQGLSGVEIEHFGVGGNGTARSHKAVDRFLAHARHREIVRDAEGVSGGVEQPVADLTILIGAMELAECQDGQEQQQASHGSLRAVMRTGSWSSRSLRKLRRTRPSASVETMAGEAEPVSS